MDSSGIPTHPANGEADIPLQSIPDVTMSIQVKPYDIDVAGIVHNSVYHCWLDDLRCQFLAQVQSIEEQVELGFIPVLARTDINYRRPIKFGDKVVAELWLVHLGKIKWRIECLFYVGSHVVTQATQEGCVVDLKSHRPIGLPKPFLVFWERQKAERAEVRVNELKQFDQYSLVNQSNQSNQSKHISVVCPV